MGGSSALHLLRLAVIACVVVAAVACDQVGSLVGQESEVPEKVPTRAEVENRGKILALTEKNLWEHVRDCPRALPIVREFAENMEKKTPTSVLATWTSPCTQAICSWPGG